MNAMKNRVQLIGNLGKDPEVRAIDNGNKMARMSIATSETYQNNKGEKVTDTQWHTVVAWGKTAELVEKLLTKGSEVALEGKLVNRSYTDKDGQKKFITEVVAQEFLLLTKKTA
ncbi:single-stranded DNA-binding protein [Phnomibacter ginsenosidimutans]|jgi:single-strand DNA-binding protein|uniref:Single-stranded DNA-binding protein n=1 Tax=Phnomibacter ginsenosidimutans TaxID=2676868 RepID=A0A6I6GH40_9BACT|nr:single-stranded DNA-binding protein [Phnomibacter ginsenosidimutans]QGW26978.1 single-stranded DNA-binding protein [Phnomibacter ginsenosidimutans]